MLHASGTPRSIAVVGSGVAGLTAAYVLSRTERVTVFEADARLGGHADTHTVTTRTHGDLSVDTGFIVHNDRTYPTLQRLFRELSVPTQESDMSMSIRCDGCGLEYSGGQGLAGILPSLATARRGRYLRMLAEVVRFHRVAAALIATAPSSDESPETVAQFLDRHRFGTYFRSHFMTPLVSAVWSCEPARALDYPARYLFTFLDHHGMLSVGGSPTWRTVTGGSARYVERVAAHIADVRTSSPVASVRRHADGVTVDTDAGDSTEFDAVVIATHPQQALKILADPTESEHRVLGAITYSPNVARLHTDSTVLPRTPRARGSWNYRMDTCAATPGAVVVTYDMTRLQRLPDTGERYLVTLGDPADRRVGVDPATVLDTMQYEHPLYTTESVAAQRELPGLTTDRTAYAGAYHGWGFHEDGAASGLRAAERLGGVWT
ncbi:NAD(P)/FAD-dependent oxidoreductase [Rhodococcoides corynebacterioides]|uniref:NAD(P)/FAD-dependent oxidoreductase n=1 Tax=Rhodococcoides corynebacterioides TaxID=53972 RepID=UPI001C9B5D16|nr:FAD-dependent oxidoreductase [Rhodococcus corynebacterioides]MBY6349804.1 FAD-dependent oxidoreductase [Rhodococcus corynebacterioides]